MAEILTTYKEFGYGGLLIMVIVFATRYLIKQNAACYKMYESQLIDHKNEIKSINDRMFKVMKEHTMASASLNDTIQRLFDRVHVDKEQPL